MAINAIRLRTTDPQDGQGRYRYLQAVNGGGAGLAAVRVGMPAQMETFLFEPPTKIPLMDGSQLSMNLCNSNWDPSGMLVRVAHGVHVYPRPSKKEPPTVTYEIGGPGQAVWVTAMFPAGYPAYPGDDPAERIFSLLKPGGGQINSGDSVSLRINSNLGQTFFFRVDGSQDGAGIFGDGTGAFLGDTTFIVEFVEVHSGIGECGAVIGTVTRALDGQPVAGASVQTLGVAGNRTFSDVTISNGTFTLADLSVTNMTDRFCMPAGSIMVRASANRFQTRTVSPVVVVGGGTTNVPIQLDCTQVKVKLVDSSNLAIIGVPVMLLDASGNLLQDLNGQNFITNTGLDGTATFNCVPHGTVKIQTTADPNQQPQLNVPPQGASTIIVVQNTCGNLVGKVVTDLVTRTGIPNATVTIVGTSLQTTTDANGDFAFNCVRPAGQKTVFATAQSCGSNTATANVPTSGNSQPVVIPLNCTAAVVDSIVAILQWGMQPSDLDIHLSGPDGQGGRFHLFFANRSQPPVPYASLDTDDTSSMGPETLTILKSGSAFVAGDYHVWVHNFVRTTFAGSSAVVTVVRLDPQGLPTQLSRQEVQFAAGNQDDDIWQVVNLDVTANGNVTVTTVQTLIGTDPNTGQPVNSGTVL